MHRQQRLHRDIKPANILSKHEGRYKLADFGISAEAANHDLQFTDFVGTLLYMSPERVQGQGTYSYSADIWSLGSPFALVMGKPPIASCPTLTWWRLSASRSYLP